MNGIHEVTGSTPVWSTNSLFPSDIEVSSREAFVQRHGGGVRREIAMTFGDLS